MTDSGDPDRSRRGPRAAKRTAIMAAAVEAFAATGYPRTSVETIAARAGVSNRTVYNHFRDKADLFSAVIEHSAAEVAQAQIAIIARDLGSLPEDLPAAERALRRFARHWTEPMPEYATHHALVGRVRAEIGHIPDAVLERWQQAGPARVRASLAEVFDGWARAGLLREGDPLLAALQFTRLVAPTDALNPARRADAKDAAILIDAGVRLFLHGVARPGPEGRSRGRPGRRG